MMNHNQIFLIITIIIKTIVILNFVIVTSAADQYDTTTTSTTTVDIETNSNQTIIELPTQLKVINHDYDGDSDANDRYTDDRNRDSKKVKFVSSKNGGSLRNLTIISSTKHNKRKTTFRQAVQSAAMQGLQAMVKLYEVKEPEMLRNGIFLEKDSPGAKLSLFNAPVDGTEQNAKAAYAILETAKILKKTIDLDLTGIGRQAPPPKISLRRTPLEGLCPARELPKCLPASRRYRTHDGTCNNFKHPRWGGSQMPFHRFLQPNYEDGIEAIRRAVDDSPLPSPRFVSLLVHGARDGDAPVTMLLPQWGQFIDHDMTATAQPRSINGTVPRCCESLDAHPACLPIKVPRDDPWLSPMGLQCLEFLRSAPAQRPDCVLSWREQTNQATSYLDGSTVYSSNARLSDNARIFRDGLLLFGRGTPREDVCLRGALANQCIRPGDSRSGEQPGLLAMHTVWVGEHNRIASELADMNSHWSDEKLYQEARRIVGAMIQHITYREFLPLVLGREVCKLFDLSLEPVGYYKGYDQRINPGVANSFGAAAFRFGHSLVQGTFIRCDRNFRVMNNNVSLHDEFSRGDTGGPGSLHRLVRGMAMQRALARDEFITPELTNHLFQTGNFPFGLDLAAINIQRGRDHGLPSYTAWRVPCGLSDIRDWSDFEKVVGPKSTQRIRQAYLSVDDVDLFVGGLAERPVVGGLIGPTFACIIAQQFSNTRKGDRFWYENPGFESTFTPAQLQSIRQVTLAQVLCRALGGGTLQPNVMLPSDISGNERKLCGVGEMGPIDLLPWGERDPFNKNIDHIDKPPTPLIQPEIPILPPTPIEKEPKPPRRATITLPIKEDLNNDDDDSDEDSDDESDDDENDQTVQATGQVLNRVTNKLDFTETAGPSQQLAAKVTNLPTANQTPAAASTVDGKLDFGQHVTPVKQISDKFVAQPVTTVNNKLDSKRKPTKVNRRPVVTAKVKRRKTVKTRQKAASKNRRNDNENDDDEEDDDDLGLIDFSFAGRRFANEDDVTGYVGNQPISQTNTRQVFRHETNYKQNQMHHNQYHQQMMHHLMPTGHDGQHITGTTDKETDEHKFKRIVLSTPDPNDYQIEINIRPNPNRPTPKPHSNLGPSTYSHSGSLGSQNRPITLSRPTYGHHDTIETDEPQDSYGQIFKRPTYMNRPTYGFPSDFDVNSFENQHPYGVSSTTTTPRPTLTPPNKYPPYSYSESKYTTPFSFDATTERKPLWTYNTKKSQYKPPSDSPYYSPTASYNVQPSLNSFYDPQSSTHNNHQNNHHQQQYHHRPTYTNYYDDDHIRTTIKPELQTFLIVETTRHTTPIPYYTTARPHGNQYPPINSGSAGYGVRPNLYDSDFYSQYGKTTGGNDETKIQRRSDDSEYETDDYDYTTYAPIHNDKYNTDNENLGSVVGGGQDNDGLVINQFDLDGYLRPDSMSYNIKTTEQPSMDGLQSKTNDDDTVEERIRKYFYNNIFHRQVTGWKNNRNPLNETNTFDDYVLPRLTAMTKSHLETIFSVKNPTQNITHDDPPLDTVRGNLTRSQINDKLDGLFSDNLPRNPTFDILSSDYADDLPVDDTVTTDLNTDMTHDLNTDSGSDMTVQARIEEQIEMRSKSRPEQISFVPIKILTKPERPDNWLIFDAPTKKPLPEMPDIVNGKGFMSSEIPKPFIKIRSKITP